MLRRKLILGACGLGALTVASGAGYVTYAHSTYSHGWRMGRLDKLSLRSSWKRAYLASTGEGELFMGRNSPVAVWTGADGQQVRNPWSFSCSPEDYERFRPLIGRMVAIHYRQLMAPMTSWGGETDYRADEIIPLDEAMAVGVCSAEGGGLRSAGERQGSIVKVTRKGRLFTSHEATIQVGTAGNQFIEMSILSEPMAQCATAYLRAGKLAIITYRESVIRNPLARDTTYDIIGIRPSTS